LNFDAYIFDVDGVLIDTSQSFSSAVLYAVEKATASSRFQLSHYNSLKEISGFNNDWDVAIAGAAWIAFYPSTSFESFLEVVINKNSEPKLFIEAIPDMTDSFLENVSQLAMEAYGGTTACKQLYGFNPTSIKIDGMWKNETPFITKNNIKNILPISGIVTGRNKTEMELGFSILGWELPDSRVAVSDNPTLDKPNPENLMNIINELACHSPIYFGDSIDDYLLVKNFNEQSKMQMKFCCVGNNNDIPESDYNVNDIMEYFKKYGAKS
jgi:phosphoglycolate phosphatase-like HAD superfamily hydrolase